MKQFIWRQKYRFDLAKEYVAYINFAMLILLVSDKLKQLTGLTGIMATVLFVAVGLCGMWVVGRFLDWMQARQMDEREWLKRSYGWRFHRETQRLVREVLQEVKREK